MQFVYNIIMRLASVLLKLVALVNPKIKLFVEGRANVFSVLQDEISESDKVFWFHCASLGEFEQGRPVIENLKRECPEYKIVLTFFSPSGYEVQKNYEFADVIVYLPLDTISNAKKFLALVHPSVAIFVKYEFWPNYLSELQKNSIPTLLISGIFRKEQLFFKSYGIWMRAKLGAFTYFFVQDQDSSNLLSSIDFQNYSVSGDTRFDRVYDIVGRDNHLDFIEEFVSRSHVLVAGSTWPEDEALLISYILNTSDTHEKFIIAPHNIKAEGVQKLKSALGDSAVLFSEMEGKKLSTYKVFIVDTIGLLTKIYSAADIAYVGGGYTRSGVHNVLEPATFGVPIVIGPNYKKFREAKDLIGLGACVTTKNQNSLEEILLTLRDNDSFREAKGKLALDYITSSLGASNKITTYIKELIS